MLVALTLQVVIPILKSNMDRFIVNEHYYIPIRNSVLKSNMDRFIGCYITRTVLERKVLKSNMDRFIDATRKKRKKISAF